MSNGEAPTPERFGRIKVRVTGLVFGGDTVALLRRDRPGSVRYSTVGGTVEHGEDFRAALAREE